MDQRVVAPADPVVPPPPPSAPPGPAWAARWQIPATWTRPLDRAPVSGPGLVASDDLNASRAGAAILAKGGNAMDAAIATAFALAVSYPNAGNIGGGGFLVARVDPAQPPVALDFRETAPKKASRNMYLGPDGKPTKASLEGHLAAGTPGSVAGLYMAHQKFGKLPWKDVVAPAIALATDGFPLTESHVVDLNEAKELLSRFPASAALFLPGGEVPKVGVIWKNPDLAKTLTRIAEKGPKDFYEGETAKLLLAEMKKGHGIIQAADLKGYKAKWREPIVVEYRGHRVISMPPPSSGGVVIALVLKTLEGFDLAKMGWHSVDQLHVFAETLRRAFALRNYWLGDPDFIKVPTELFVAPEAAEKLRASIDLTKATPSSEIQLEDRTKDKGMHTTHLSVVDAAGGAVAMTTTINMSFGAGVVVTGAGFLLNDEMDDFAVAPGQPNGFGLVQGERNAVAPGRRMLSSMSPTIVLGPDGQPKMVSGAAGGPTIITATLQTILNVVDYGMTASEASSAPRMHHQHLPDAIMVEENGFSPEVLDGLTKRGHAIVPKKSIADTNAIVRGATAWESIAEPRNGGSGAAAPLSTP